MGEVSHGGGHDAREGLSVGARLAVGLVEGLELPLGGSFMVEDLDDLLALDHLLDIAVHLAHSLLLLHKIPPAPSADELHRQHHHKEHPKGDAGQDGTENDHHGDGPQEGQRTGDETSKAVVQGLGDGLNVVGIAAHQLAVGMGIKVFQGQALHLFKEVLPDLRHRVLGHMDHDAGIAIRAHRAGNVHRRHDAQHPGKAGKVPGEDIVVDQGLDEEAAAHGAGGADHQQHRHNAKVQPISAQIPHELADGLFEVLGLLEAASGSSAAGSSAGRRAHGSFILSHRCSLLPAGRCRPRGRSRRSSSVLHACPGPQYGPGPSPQ